MAYWPPSLTIVIERHDELAVGCTTMSSGTSGGGPGAAKKSPSKRKPNAAFMRPVQPDAKLSTIVGSKPLPRSELTKKLWDYIKKNGLQDKKKRTQINADDALRPVFNGKSQVSMFEMTKLVSGHIR
jgi:chromatin remodeling complex protein RSC6